MERLPALVQLILLVLGQTFLQFDLLGSKPLVLRRMVLSLAL